MPNKGRIQNHVFRDARDEIMRRAEGAGYDYLVDQFNVYNEEGDLENGYNLVLLFPKGVEQQQTRTITVEAFQADDFAELDFENFEAIGPYRAIYNTASGEAEALMSPPHGEVGMAAGFLIHLPGVEIFRSDEMDLPTRTIYKQYTDVPIPPGTRWWQAIGNRQRHFTWRLPVADPPGELKVEISPASKQFETFVGIRNMPGDRLARVTLKVNNIQTTSLSELSELISNLAMSTFFDMDLRFGLAFTLVLHQNEVPRRRFPLTVSDSRTVSHPGVRYSRPATMLYFYGRSSGDAPLLRYLAYYQAIEHFFPLFVNRDVVLRVRNMLRDPTFNPSADGDIEKLIRRAGVGPGRGSPEREQLRIAIQQSVEDDDVQEYLEEISESDRKFLAKKNALVGVPQLGSVIPTRLTEQAAERMYALRCRIVHAKDSKSEFVEPLLPLSREASLLGPDILLAEFLCQKAIIAGSSAQT